MKTQYIIQRKADQGEGEDGWVNITPCRSLAAGLAELADFERNTSEAGYYRLIKRTTTDEEVDDGVRYGWQKEDPDGAGYAKMAWTWYSTHNFPTVDAANVWAREMNILSRANYRLVKIIPLP